MTSPSEPQPARPVQGAPARVTLVRVPSRTKVVEAALPIVLDAAQNAIASRGEFRIALAGGSTPAPLYAQLAHLEGIDWPHWQVYFGDERTVAPDNPASNFRMVREALLDKLQARGIAPARVERIYGEDVPVDAAARYDATLRTLASDGDVPRFDLILLGMGGDGHTASLFPHTAALHESTRLAVANEVPQLSTTRITITWPLIRRARRILFLVSGADKASALSHVLTGAFELERWPSQGVQLDDGEVTWIVDEAAASQLAQTPQSAKL